MTRPASPRSYYDGCIAAHGLDLVGERWALLVVRELVFGPKRFSDLRAGLPGISPNVLTQRLEELETAAIVRRRRLPPPAAVSVYELTEWGRELEPVITAIAGWAARSPHLKLGVSPFSADALLLSMRAVFSPAAALRFGASIDLVLGDDRFHAEIADGRLDIARGSAERPDAVIAAGPRALAALVYGGRSLAQAERSGAVSIEGDRAVIRRFLGLFPLPERARAAPPPPAGRRAAARR
jgi:DNA-binding HxlR family transcriptional regulator